MRAYFYANLSVSWAASLGAEYFEQIGEPDAFNDQLIARARTTRLPLQLRWFGSNRFYARVRGTYINQAGMFSDGPFQTAVLSGADRFEAGLFAVEYFGGPGNLVALESGELRYRDPKIGTERCRNCFTSVAVAVT